MKSFLRILRVEILKLKRTLALGMAVIAPLVVVLLQCLLVLYMKKKMLAPGVNTWEAVSNSIMLWAVLMLPLFITLETSLLGQTEHNGDQWKLLFAQPVRRGGVYAAKTLVAAGLVLLSDLVLFAGMALAGTVLHFFYPMTAAGPIPWANMFLPIGRTFLASWFIVAIHTFIGLRWKSFTVSVGAGIVATIGSTMVVNSDRWSRIFPWSLPAIATGKTGVAAGSVIALGMAGGLVAAIIGCLLFVRRDVI